MKETENLRAITTVAFDQTFFVELKRILFRSGISLNEFFSYVVRLTVTGDPRIHEVLSEAVKARAQKEEISGIVHTDDESLYNLIEEKRLHNNKKE